MFIGVCGIFFFSFFGSGGWGFGGNCVDEIGGPPSGFLAFLRRNWGGGSLKLDLFQTVDSRNLERFYLPWIYSDFLFTIYNMKKFKSNEA